MVKIKLCLKASVKFNFKMFIVALETPQLGHTMSKFSLKKHGMSIYLNTQSESINRQSNVYKHNRIIVNLDNFM